MPNFSLILKELQILPHLEIMVAALSTSFFHVLWHSDLVWGVFLKRERERVNKPVSAQRQKWGQIFLFIMYILLGYGIAFFAKDKVLTSKFFYLLFKKAWLRFLLTGAIVMIGNWADNGKSMKIWLLETAGGFLSLILLGTVMSLLGVIHVG